MDVTWTKNKLEVQTAKGRLTRGMNRRAEEPVTKVSYERRAHGESYVISMLQAGGKSGERGLRTYAYAPLC